MTPYTTAIPKIRAALLAAGATSVDIVRRDHREDVLIRTTCPSEDVAGAVHDAVQAVCEDIGWRYLDCDGGECEPYFILGWDEERIPLSVHRAGMAAMHRRAQRAESEVARLRRQLAALSASVAAAHPGQWDHYTSRREWYARHKGVLPMDASGVPWPVANAFAVLASVRDLPPWGLGPKPSPAYAARVARDRRVSAEIRAAMSAPEVDVPGNRDSGSGEVKP